jgi:tetratricopeptide (TPR) repeat protein
MKRCLFYLLLILPAQLFCLEFNETKTEHYTIRTTLSPEETAERGVLMERLYSRFTKLTGQPNKDLTGLTITEFSGEDDFCDYLSLSKNDLDTPFLLLRRGESHRPEILFYSIDEETTHRYLIHLALFQYLEACNNQTPFWLKAGLARYFETLPIDFTGEDVPPFNENAYEEWLDLAKTGSPSLRSLLSEETTLINENERELHIAAWGLVSYLMNAQGKEGRFLWETLSLARTNRKDEWLQLDVSVVEKASTDYLLSLEKPEKDNIALKKLYENATREDVIKYINDNNLEESWLGPYYEGLIHYNRGLYADALYNFRKAAERSAPEAEVLFSQALCLWELNKEEEARILFGKAKEIKEEIIPEELNRLLALQ